MFTAAITGSTSGKLYSSSFGRKQNKSAKLRTAYKGELPTAAYGEVDALLTKSKDKNMVFGYKSLPKPTGASAFESDLFRLGARVWELPAKSVLPPGIVALNLEPGYWVLAPQEDTELTKYASLLEESPWVQVDLAIRRDFGTKADKLAIDRQGLAMIDNLVVQSMQNFIRESKRRIGLSKYEEEIAHIDNDISRTREYLIHYRDDPTKHEDFIKK